MTDNDAYTRDDMARAWDEGYRANDDERASREDVPGRVIIPNPYRVIPPDMGDQ